MAGATDPRDAASGVHDPNASVGSHSLESAGASVGVEYQRLLALEQERRRRRDNLEALLPTIADALDVRVVFPRLSDVIQDVIPHVTVAIALLTPDGLGVKVHVASNYDVGDLPVYRFTD